MENNNTIDIATNLGYKGNSNKEAKNWITAVDKGLDMSEEARYKRAELMGFNTDCVYHHGSKNKFDVFDKTKIGENYSYSEDSGFFFTKKMRSAENYALLHSGGKDKGYVISAFLKFSNPYTTTTNSDYYAPADRFDISGHDMMHDVRIEGNDCILIKGTRNDDLCVVFEPNQILSINSAFDPETISYENTNDPIDNSITDKLIEITERESKNKMDKKNPFRK